MNRIKIWIIKVFGRKITAFDTATEQKFCRWTLLKWRVYGLAEEKK